MVFEFFKNKVMLRQEGPVCIVKKLNEDASLIPE
jgi:hypothetical protein